MHWPSKEGLRTTSTGRDPRPAPYPTALTYKTGWSPDACVYWGVRVGVRVPAPVVVHAHACAWV